MTGLDALREEMRKRGATEQMVKSKTVAMVLEILSEGNAYSTDQWEIEERERKLEFKEEHYKTAVQRDAETKLREAEHVYCDARQMKAEVDENVKYIEGWFDGLNQCETPEARDNMRTAQVFINTVNVDTKYDNTAFIVALSAILTGGKINGVKELKKINKDFAKKTNYIIWEDV